MKLPKKAKYLWQSYLKIMHARTPDPGHQRTPVRPAPLDLDLDLEFIVMLASPLLGAVLPERGCIQDVPSAGRLEFTQ